MRASGKTKNRKINPTETDRNGFENRGVKNKTVCFMNMWAEPQTGGVRHYGGTQEHHCRVQDQDYLRSDLKTNKAFSGQVSTSTSHFNSCAEPISRLRLD